MKITLYEISDVEARIYADKLSMHSLTFFPDKLSASSSYVADTQVLSVFVNSKVDRNILDKMPQLKCIAVRATGFDNVDLSTCHERGVVVCNVPDYGSSTVAEFTFAILLNLQRRLFEANRRVKELGQFSDNDLMGVELFGKKMGVIGYGRIGKKVVQIAKVFGMEVLVFDPFIIDVSFADSSISFVAKEELLRNSDVVSLHVPYSEKTHHIISLQDFKMMKPEAVLINTSRGGIINTQDLVIALEQKLIGGAALDVIEGETFIRDELEFLKENSHKPEEMEMVLSGHALMHMDNVLITPHMAYFTRDALARIEGITLENIIQFVAGGIQNQVK